MFFIFQIDNELKINRLKHIFDLSAGPDGVLSLKNGTFRHRFPFFQDNGSDIEEAFFNVFTSGDTVSFHQYLKVISVFRYGSVEDKTKLSMKMFQIREDKVICGDLLEFLRRINKVLSHNKDFERLQPSLIVKTIFQTEPEATEELRRKVKEFDFFRYFGSADKQEPIEGETSPTSDSKNDTDSLPETPLSSLYDGTPFTATRANAIFAPLYVTDFIQKAKQVPEFTNCFGIFKLFWKQNSMSLLVNYAGDVQSFISNLSPLLKGLPNITSDTIQDFTKHVFKENKVDKDFRLSKLFDWISKNKSEKKEDTNNLSKEEIDLLDKRSRLTLFDENHRYGQGIIKLNDKHFISKVANGFLIQYDINDETFSNPIRTIVLQNSYFSPLSDLTFALDNAKNYNVFEISNFYERHNWKKLLTQYVNMHSFKHNSFSPVRENQFVEFFILAKHYYTDLKANLLAARESIMFTGWQMNALIYLERENILEKTFKEILWEKASEGVKIYILIWKELSFLVPLHSDIVASLLKHENVNIIRDDGESIDSVWSHHQKLCVIDGAVAYVGGVDVSYSRWDDEYFSIIDEEGIKYPTYDFYNGIAGIAQFNEIIPPIVNERYNIPRIPWEDTHLKIVGEAVLDVERNFIQRWEASRKKSEPIIIPHTTIREPSIAQDKIQQKPLEEPLAILKTGAVPCKELNSQQSRYNNCTVQILRSGPNWGFKLGTNEASLYIAQLEAIRNSKHFIYIENQYFISTTDDIVEDPKNILIYEIVQRIVRAHTNGDKFKVVIVHPPQPSSSVNGLLTYYTLAWQLDTIIYGEYGLEKSLKRHGINMEDYIYMISLRNYGRFSNKKLTTEIIYIHSKLMVVDDDIAFISSCNINDRSLLGSRDSEIGAIIIDKNKTPVQFGGDIPNSISKKLEPQIDNQTIETIAIEAHSEFNGITLQCSEFAHSLRKQKFMLMLGELSHEELQLLNNPLHAAELLRERANKNSEIYLQVFKYTHDNIEKDSELPLISNYENRYQIYSDEDYETLRQNIKGFAVNYSKNFLKQSWMNPELLTSFNYIYC